MSATRAPAGLKVAGRRLWREITEQLILDQHELAMLTEACRTLDGLDVLAAIIEAEGAMVAGRPHPALVEARQQRLTFARLIASLRLPESLDGSVSVDRPQRRGAARGSYLRAV